VIISIAIAVVVLLVFNLIFIFISYRLAFKRLVRSIVEHLSKALQTEVIRLEGRITKLEALLVKDTIRGGDIYEGIMSELEEEVPEEELDNA
jgi:hypothetical protein